MRSTLFCLSFQIAFALGCVTAEAPSPLDVPAATGEDAGVFELASGEVFEFPVPQTSARKDMLPQDPFADFEVSALFVAPGRAEYQVEGFYDAGNGWLVRFLPPSPGRWRFTVNVNHSEKHSVHSGVIDCKGAPHKGFLRISKKNHFRLEWENGVPFYPIGIQPGSQGPRVGLDGGQRDRQHGRGRGSSADFKTYLAEFQGKANLFRIQLGQGTSAGCAQQILTVRDGRIVYDIEQARILDNAVRELRAHGFAVIIIPFQDMSLWGYGDGAFGHNRDLDGWKNIKNENAVRPVKQYLRYLIARYAAQTDIWEIFNEDSFTSNEWLRDIAHYIRSLDPYGHIVTTNYERPTEDWCELVNPHEYMWMDASEVDAHLTKEIARFKSFGKPVVYTEFGNQGTLSNRDPVKWRIAVWTAFMNEAAILFWHMGGGITSPRPQARGNANAYLGPEAREYFRVLQDFTRDVPVTLRPAFNGYAGPGEFVRRYALSDGKMTLLYVHHYRDQQKPIRADVFVWTGPGEFDVTWIDPATGNTVATEKTAANGQVCRLKTPDVAIDIAAKIIRAD